MTALRCAEQDRVPLGEWHVDRPPMESYMGRKIVNLQDERESLEIIVAGAPVTREFADQIGADGYSYDSPGAAQICKELVSG